MASHGPLFAKVGQIPYQKEHRMGREHEPAHPVPPHPELWGGLERDLGRLQGLMDGAVERMAEDVRLVLTCLQFHDIATQMITNMRSRSALLELAALVAVPGEAAAEHARLLEQASQLSRRCPDDSWNDQGGDVELF
jgi:hypothetical protein